MIQNMGMVEILLAGSGVLLEMNGGLLQTFHHVIMVGPGKDSLIFFEDSIFQYDPCCTRPEFHEAEEGQQL